MIFLESFYYEFIFYYYWNQLEVSAVAMLCVLHINTTVIIGRDLLAENNIVTIVIHVTS